MGNMEKIGSSDTGVSNTYEQYTGACDVYNPLEAFSMAEELRLSRRSPNRKVMIGVMAHPLILNPDIQVPEVVRKELQETLPAREQLAGGFIDDPDVFNTIHYADLYGPNGPWEAGASPDIYKNLKLCVQYGGENLHAIQLDVTWPSASELKRFKSEHPDIAIVLQIGRFAIKATGNDPSELVNRLREYGNSIDYVLLDMSMGKGKEMDSAPLLAQLRQIRNELPYLGLAVAGGLGPDSADLLKSIAQEFPDISVDAQGNLKPKDAPRDSLGHLSATTPANLRRTNDYIHEVCRILDNPTPNTTI